MNWNGKIMNVPGNYSGIHELGMTIKKKSSVVDSHVVKVCVNGNIQRVTGRLGSRRRY